MTSYQPPEPEPVELELEPDPDEPEEESSSFDEYELPPLPATNVSLT